MAACSSLSSLFDNPLQDSSRKLLGSLSTWSEMKSNKEMSISGLTEIFGELYFEPTNPPDEKKGKKSGGFATSAYESLQLCTEGLGSESSDDLDDFVERGGEEMEGERRPHVAQGSSERRRNFPPPISSIGGRGKQRIFLRSYRGDGRFVLKEVRIPTQEFLRASREDGRLKLRFVHHGEEILEEEGDDEAEGEQGTADLA
ncbi:hypothetical protein HPP92_006116 [Vanilla planifolia]|uniref:FAF domain-containing protein n=1 Tax=Vanilla planifolia TaxID=51239 RepID=A0A835S0V7_VANPL|nr:hypothetical protein HPP92_006116 [Vanilla planifolia]